MNMAIWIIVFVLLSVFAVYAWRMSRATDEDNSHDVGQAIMDFARAFPNEAIRSLHMTVDGGAAFVRLHDNKAGFMRNMGSHYVCVMIDPERIRVESLESGDGFVVTFFDMPNIAAHIVSSRRGRRLRYLSGCSAALSRRRTITAKTRCPRAPEGALTRLLRVERRQRGSLFPLAPDDEQAGCDDNENAEPFGWRREIRKQRITENRR